MTTPEQLTNIIDVKGYRDIKDPDDREDAIYDNHPPRIAKAIIEQLEEEE